MDYSDFPTKDEWLSDKINVENLPVQFQLGKNIALYNYLEYYGLCKVDDVGNDYKFQYVLKFLKGDGKKEWFERIQGNFLIYKGADFAKEALACKRISDPNEAPKQDCPCILRFRIIRNLLNQKDTYKKPIYTTDDIENMQLHVLDEELNRIWEALEAYNNKLMQGGGKKVVLTRSARVPRVASTF